MTKLCTVIRHAWLRKEKEKIVSKVRGYFGDKYNNLNLTRIFGIIFESEAVLVY